MASTSAVVKYKNIAFIPEIEKNSKVFQYVSVIINLLVPRSRVLLEKLIGSQLVKKLLAFYVNRSFVIAFTSARHLALS
jgi:hypothetical protein